MNKAFFLLSLSAIFLALASQVMAQIPFKDTAEIIFGQGGSAPEPTGEPGGGDDGLGPGEFKPPFKCDVPYVGSSYDGHTPYAVDFNRAPFGADDGGDPVRAVADGKVVVHIPACGKITVRHEGGYYSTYGHMRNISVRTGQSVKLGQKIGEIWDVSNANLGCRATGPHLHTHHTRFSIYNYIKLAYNNNPYPASANPSRDLGPDWRINGQCP